MTIFCAIAIFGNVSGGHFNPAVTLGVLVKDGLDKVTANMIFAVMIIFAQLVGASIGVCLAYMMTKSIDVSTVLTPD